MDHSGEYFTIGDFIAFHATHPDLDEWRVSRISDLTVNSMKCTVTGIFYNKEDAIAAMRRNGLHVVKELKAAHVV